tara:strand:- start:1048 stop:1548 length:501 start_codon:yes stop_codon:yes gene_type:complete
MLRINFLKKTINLGIVLIIFSLDRISKIYILKLAEVEDVVNIYINSNLNFYLIWNKGIAFGLLSYDQNILYNILTSIIGIISIIILILVIKLRDIRVFFLALILGGSLGNLFDRIYYAAVPDFIDFHIGSFHWFIFNVADIFISIGVLCLIFVELFYNKKEKNETV